MIGDRWGVTDAETARHYVGRRSPRELRGLPEPVAGEPFTRVGGRPSGRSWPPSRAST